MTFTYFSYKVNCIKSTWNTWKLEKRIQWTNNDKLTFFPYTSIFFYHLAITRSYRRPISHISFSQNTLQCYNEIWIYTWKLQAIKISRFLWFVYVLLLILQRKNALWNVEETKPKWGKNDNIFCRCLFSRKNMLRHLWEYQNIKIPCTDILFLLTVFILLEI